jgi:hypothetical protein
MVWEAFGKKKVFELLRQVKIPIMESKSSKKESILLKMESIH